jgi:hypothetical protein
MNQPKYRIFYINHGKFFLSVVDGVRQRQAITKHHKEFNKLCLWFSFDECVKIIKHNRTFPEVWGVVDETGKQWTVGKFDGILKKG